MSETTVITMVVDESGSMAHLREATQDGFNEYVQSLQTSMKDEAVYFSAILFDTRGIRKLQVGSPLKDAVKLTVDNYTPTGGTPLLDATGRAIAATDEVMATHKGTKAIVVVQTDGEENSSQVYTLAVIKTMIEERTAKGWQFVFMGCGIDAYKSGAGMGFSRGSTVSYGATGQSTRATFAATASNTTLYSGGQSATMNYADAQKAAAGDMNYNPKKDEKFTLKKDA